jgi:Family of unknown function (DUF5681)
MEPTVAGFIPPAHRARGTNSSKTTTETAMNKTAKRVIGRPWQPGQSGNPAGRPLGSRHKITEAIIQDISGAWQTHGPQVLDRLAVEDPATFAKLAVGLVPKDVLLSINTKLPGGMDPDDWQLVTAAGGIGTPPPS